MIERDSRYTNLSQIIAWVRLPLIIGVVLAHANLYALVENWYGETPVWPQWLIFIFYNFKNILLPERVAVLFLISGFFFFKGIHRAEPNFFINKLKRRVHSLLVPYIVWNTIALILFYIKSNEVLGSLSVQSGEEFSIIKYLSGYWAFYFTGDTPANMPLWFVRNLMVICLLTPLLYRLLRTTWSWFFLIVLAFCLVYDIVIPVNGLDISSIFFFSLGAWLQINNVSIVTIPAKVGWMAVALYIPLSYFQFGLYDEPWYILCALATVLIKAIALVFAVSELFKHRIICSVPKIAEQTFYLYALHGLIIGPVIKILYILSGATNNPFLLLFISLLSVFFVVLLSSISYNVLKKYAPSFLKILSGGR